MLNGNEYILKGRRRKNLLRKKSQKRKKRNTRKKTRKYGGRFSKDNEMRILRKITSLAIITNMKKMNKKSLKRYIKKKRKTLKYILKKYSKKFKDNAVLGSGKHTPCLLSVLAKQEQCIQKNILSSSRGNKNIDDTYSYILDSVCSSESIQKILKNWNNGKKLWSNGECGIKIENELIKTDAFKDKRNASKEKIRRASLTPEEREQENKILSDFLKELEDERKADEDGIFLLDKKEDGSDNIVTFGGRKKKKMRKTHRIKKIRRGRKSHKKKRKH